MSSRGPLDTLSAFLNDTLDSVVSSALLAVSGGCDSMVLLDAFARTWPGEPKRVHVLHFNHRLNNHVDRAREHVSDRVRRAGFSLVEAEAVRSKAVTQSRRGVEAQARDHRYDFFESVARTLGVQHLFLAHHRLDQVETVLLDLGRGAGPGGLTGMEPVSRRRGMTLCRPFLDLNPRVLEEYADERGLDYAEDPSNEDVQFARNRIRHRILPEWREVQPDPDSAIANHARRNSLENDFWASYLEDRFSEWIWSGEVQLDRDQFHGVHTAAQLRYLHFLCHEVLSVGQGFDETNYRDLRSLFEEGRSGARLSLPGEAYALNEYERGCISIRPADTWSPIQGVSPPRERTLEGIGTVLLKRERTDLELPGPTFYARFGVPSGERTTLRCWSSGDQYEDDGRLRKLKKLFSDRRVPYRARRLWPLVVLGERIRAVPGLHNGTRADGETWWIGFQPEHPTFKPLLEEEGDRRMPDLLEPGEPS